MKLNRNYDRWEEWQKVAYQDHKKTDLEKMVLLAEARIGRNYVFVIDRPEPYLENHGMLRIYINGHCFQYGGTREYGLNRFNGFVTNIKNHTIRLPYDVPLYTN